MSRPPKTEEWDLFDKDGNFKCKFVKGRGSIPDSLYHKTIEVIPTDMEGHLLLTQRSLSKAMAPGKLEFPAGSVISGETEEQAVLRELHEETGLRPTKIFFLQKARTRGVIRYTYLAYIPEMTTKKIKYDKNEVMNHTFVTYEQWMDILTSWEYNSFRTCCYTERLFANVKSIVNKHAAAQQEPKTHAPLRLNSTLATKISRYLDARCYEQDPFIPPDFTDLEPICETGDDGT